MPSILINKTYNIIKNINTLYFSCNKEEEKDKNRKNIQKANKEFNKILEILQKELCKRTDTIIMFELYNKLKLIMDLKIENINHDENIEIINYNNISNDKNNFCLVVSG